MSLSLYTLMLCVVTVLSAKTTRIPKSTVPTPPPQDLVTTLTNDGNYTRILYLLGEAGLLPTLLAAPNVTLFLPTDEAINRVPVDVINDLSTSNQLKDVLLYHAVTTEQHQIRHRDNDAVLTSANGKPIRINLYDKPNRVHTAEGVKVVDEDIRVTNGWVHGIDGIMTAPAGNIVDIIANRTDMTTLTALLKMANLTDKIRADHNITVFAPTDDAFAKLPAEVTSYLTDPANAGALKQILLYHVVPKTTLYSIGMRHAQEFPTADKGHDNLMLLEDFISDDVYINRVLVTEKDISATNGVLHVLDGVQIPTRILISLERHGLNLG